jgi:hypothetical protein
MEATTSTQADGPVTAGTTFTKRLRAAADACEELEEQLSIARARRNELIAQGYDDEGMSYGHIAKHTRLSRPSIIKIMGAT